MTSVVTVVSRKSAHGTGTLQARQGGGWEALFKFEPRKSAHVMFTANWANNNVQQYNPVDFYHNRVDSKCEDVMAHNTLNGTVTVSVA